MSEEEHVSVITDREELYDKCENMEQLFDKYYLPLLVKHYSKVYQLQQENKQLKERINKAIEYIRSNYIEVLKYDDLPSEMTSYEIVTVDLLKILEGKD